MAIKDRHEDESTALKGVNLSTSETKVPFGSFVRLENWVPSGLRAIKKKRGVAVLDGIPSPPLDIVFSGFGFSECAALGCSCIVVGEGDTLIATSSLATESCGCFFGPLGSCVSGLQFARVTFLEVIAGNPLSGVAIAVSNDATALAFTGYGLIYDPGHVTDKLKIVKWNAQALTALGTVLASQNVTLNPGDTIGLSQDTTTGDLQGYINDVPQLALVAVDSDFLGNPNMGLVVVGTAGAEDRMRWQTPFVTCVEPLTLISPSNFSIQCLTAKQLIAIAGGGLPPYTFEATGGLNLVQDENTVTVTPPSNPGSAVSGTAFTYALLFTQASLGSCSNIQAVSAYGCNDQLLSDNTFLCNSLTGDCNSDQSDSNCVAGTPCATAGGASCNGSNLHCSPPAQPPQQHNDAYESGTFPFPVINGVRCDRRSASMILQDCKPCSLVVNDLVLSVTDALGNIVSQTITI